jgi:hypothetical protein
VSAVRRWSWLVLLAAPALVLACSGGGEAAPPTTGSFCDAWTALDNSALSDASGDEADFGELVESSRSLFETLRDNAPPEVQGDATALADAYGTFADYLATVGYDLSGLPTAPPAVQTALGRLAVIDDDTTPLGAYVEANCGVDLPHPQFSSIGSSL